MTAPFRNPLAAALASPPPPGPREDHPFMHALQFVLDQERDPRESVGDALVSGAGAGDAYGEYVGKHRAEYDTAQQSRDRQQIANFNVGFWHDQWQRSGAEALPKNLGLIHFDAAVNHGQGAAQRLLRQSGGDPERYIELREHLYRSIPNTSTENPPGQAGGYGEGGPSDNPGWLEKRMPALRAAAGLDPRASTIGQIAQQRDERF